MIAKEYPTQEYLNECFNYNDITGELTWKRRPPHHFKSEIVMRQWNTKNSNKKAGTILHNKKSGKKYLQVGIGGELYLVHRIAYIMKKGRIGRAEQVDHNDCDGLNNSWENLFLAKDGYLDNNKNHRKQCNNTSGVTGVSWNKNINKWVARIGSNGKRILIGYFSNIEDAKKARIEYEKILNYNNLHGRERSSELAKS